MTSFERGVGSAAMTLDRLLPTDVVLHYRWVVRMVEYSFEDMDNEKAKFDQAR